KGARYTRFIETSTAKKQCYTRIPLLPAIPDRKKDKTIYSLRVSTLIEAIARGERGIARDLERSLYRSACDTLFAEHKYRVRSQLFGANAALLGIVNAEMMR